MGLDRFPEPPRGMLKVSAYTAGHGAGACILSVIVPTLNEAENIVPLLTAVRNSLDPLLGAAYEVIVVDDDSQDGTCQIASDFMAGYPQMRLTRRAERGLSSAVIRGWQVSRGNLLATINADMQHPPWLLQEMLRRMETADVAVATRYAAGGSVGAFPLHRQILSSVARKAGRLLAPMVFKKVSDPLSGFFMLKRSVIENIELRPAGFKTLIEVLGRGRASRVAEVGYSMRERQSGSSNVRLRHWLDYLVQLARIRAESGRRV